MTSLETRSDSGTAQREVAVKKTRGLTGRTLAFVLCLALPAYAQDAGVSDAPRLPSATRLDNGSVLLSPEAFTAVDTEMKRLQAVERDNALLLERMKKDQEKAKGAAQWVIPLIIGALAGAAIAVPVTLAVAPPAKK